MGDILGIGVTHYPGLIQPDRQMAGLLDRTLKSEQVPEELKDPARWPEPMRKDWMMSWTLIWSRGRAGV